MTRQNSPNDNHWHRIEEQRHAEHMQRREQARAGDETLTIEQGEAMLQAIRYRREVARLRDALRDALEQKREVQS